MSDNLEDDDEKDETKRKSRNLSEKKRRDQFNLLITELGTMVTQNNRKMDKTTVLKTTISYLRQQNEMSQRSQADDIQTDWKPQFLSTEEFTHLMLEAVDGFIIVLGTDGHIMYTSESLTSLLGYLPSSLQNSTLYELVGDGDKIPLYNTLNIIPSINTSEDHQIQLQIHVKRCSVPSNTEAVFELVQLSGYFRKWVNPAENSDAGLSDDEDKISVQSSMSISAPYRLPLGPLGGEKTVFVATGRLLTPQLIRELPVVHSSQTEFTSRHSLEWKFLFVDHRAPPIIGYLTFELLGTSGYDYYHCEDLEQVAACHEALKQTGECTSCYYRFLTKGQQWIWLQTRYYITYHQWNSKPEFIVATHKVVNYKEVLDQQNKLKTEVNDSTTEKHNKTQSFRSGSPTWSSKSSMCGSDRTGWATSSRMSDSVTSDSHPVNRQSMPPNSRIGRCELSSSDDHCLDPLDSFSVTSGGMFGGEEQSREEDRQNIYLTPAQIALQEQLKSKHSELSRRIALQQAELIRLGEQLALTYQQPTAFYNNQQQPQQQQQQQQQQHVLNRESETFSIQQQHHPYLNPPQPPAPPQQQATVVLQPNIMVRSHGQTISGSVLQHPQQQQNTEMDVGFTDPHEMENQYLSTELIKH